MPAAAHSPGAGAVLTGHPVFDAIIAVGAVATAITATVVLLRALFGFRPLRWLFRRNVSDPISAWMKTQVSAVVEERVAPLVEQAQDTSKELAMETAAVTRQFAKIATTMDKAVERVVVAQTEAAEARKAVGRIERRVKVVESKIDKVHESVTTGNDLSVGEFARAQESRRISRIPAAQRTPEEAAHLKAAPLPSRRRSR